MSLLNEELMCYSYALGYNVGYNIGCYDEYHKHWNRRALTK